MEVNISPFSLLPNELLDFILLLVGQRDVYTLALVCKSWLYAPELIITKLDLRKLNTDMIPQYNLTRLTNITKINMVVREFSIKSFTKLTSLDLGHSINTFAGVSLSAVQLTNLTCLKANHNSGAFNLTNLQKLRVTSYHGMNSSTFPTSLTWLDISTCRANQTNISRLTNLVLLKANIYNLGDDDILPLTNLTTLDISFPSQHKEYHAMHREITKISHLCKLTSLCLNGNYHIVNDQISQLTNLTVLSLVNNNTITDDGLRPLTNLTWLNLSRSSIGIGFVTNIIKWLQLPSGQIIENV